MTFFVNFSSTHQVKVSKAIAAFSKLCDEYFKSRCWSMCPGIFDKPTNTMWVGWQYYRHLKTLIVPYKLGQLTTDEFLNRLQTIFYFLKDEKLVFKKSTINAICQNRNDLLSLQNVDPLSPLNNKNIAFALLEEAWNAIIDFEDSDISKFEYLRDQSEPVYFFSNSNELNVHRILNLLKKHVKTVKWEDEIDISNKNDETPVKIADNMYLCLSYRFRSFKTDKDNSENNFSTPSLLKKLVGNLGEDLSKIHVVSQYNKDLEEAINLGITNTHTARDYYPSPIQTVTSGSSYELRT